MYGGTTPVAGGIGTIGGLAATGADSTWPIIISVALFAIGGLLMARNAYLRRLEHAN